jgi:7-cyano-7-deazaguanine reductase
MASKKKKITSKTKNFDKAPAKTQASVRAAAKSDGLEKKYGTIAIENNKLEAFPNRTRQRRYTIDFEIPEFTCLCPRSGFPDFATIYIRYIPDGKCVELKSLKLYINGFRNEPVFHEDVTNRIIDDLINLLDPWEIEVVGDFTVRGNIKTIITSTHKKD